MLGPDEWQPNSHRRIFVALSDRLGLLGRVTVSSVDYLLAGTRLG